MDKILIICGCDALRGEPQLMERHATAVLDRLDRQEVWEVMIWARLRHRKVIVSLCVIDVSGPVVRCGVGRCVCGGWGWGVEAITATVRPVSANLLNHCWQWERQKKDLLCLGCLLVARMCSVITRLFFQYGSTNSCSLGQCFTMDMQSIYAISGLSLLHFKGVLPRETI